VLQIIIAMKSSVDNMYNRVRESSKALSLILVSICFVTLSTVELGFSQGVDMRPTIHKLVDSTGKEKVICFLLVAPGECEKCVGLIDDGFRCVNSTKGSKARLVGAIRCARKAEMRVFAKNYDWHHEMILDDGRVREMLGLGVNVRLVIYSMKTGHELGTILTSDLTGSICAKLDGILKNLE
jgi:hypothetical protein